MGGYDGATRQCLSTVEAYNPNSNTWSYISEMGTRRSGAGTRVLVSLPVKGDVLYHQVWDYPLQAVLKDMPLSGHVHLSSTHLGDHAHKSITVAK